MLILHAADFHLERRYNKFESDKAKILQAEALEFFSQLVSYAKENKASAVLICGDLFDTLSVKKSTQNMVLNEIARLKSTKFFYCLGNHDHKTLFSGELPENFVVFSDFQKFELDGVTIGGKSLVKFTDSNISQGVDFDPDKVNIYMAHADLTDKKTPDCKSFEISEVKGRNIDYLALGHKHNRSNGKIDSRGEWVYAGNGGVLNFTEGAPGFVEINIEGGKITWNRVNFLLRRNFVNETLQVSGKDEQALQSEIEKLLSQKRYSDLIRLTFVGECEENLKEFLTKVRLDQENKFFHFETIDQTKLKIDIEKLKSETLSLKAEFITLVLNSTLTEEQKDNCIKLGVDLLRGEEVDI